MIKDGPQTVDREEKKFSIRTQALAWGLNFVCTERGPSNWGSVPWDQLFLTRGFSVNPCQFYLHVPSPTLARWLLPLLRLISIKYGPRFWRSWFTRPRGNRIRHRRFSDPVYKRALRQNPESLRERERERWAYSFRLYLQILPAIMVISPFFFEVIQFGSDDHI